ncbi:cell division protein ZapA [Calditrichota bacterium]
MSTQKIRVNIFGSEYVLKASENQEYIINIAKFVDEKMRAIDKSNAINSKSKVAILTALNIAEELFEEREYRKRLFDQLNEQSRKLNRSLEDALE